MMWAGGVMALGFCHLYRRGHSRDEPASPGPEVDSEFHDGTISDMVARSQVQGGESTGSASSLRSRKVLIEAQLGIHGRHGSP